MRGKVFIGWTMDQSLAVCVKNELRKHNYMGICGGREGSNKILSSIGATVVSQMNECSSAIMLFSSRSETVRDDNGNPVTLRGLSPNMLYELGYLSGSLNLRRVLSVYLDGAEELVPTDIKGGWRETASTTGKTNEELAREIVAEFLRGQCDLITGNKIELMTDLSGLRSIVREHIEKPVYYDDEIAFIVLLLCQASYMHDEMDNDEKLISELLDTGTDDQSCKLAINATLSYFEACGSLEEIEFSHGLQLPIRAYKRLRRKLTQYVDEAEAMEDGQFRSMFLMIAYDYLTFINMMHYGARPADEVDQEELDFREQSALNSIYYADKFIEYDDNSNAQVGQLYLSYTLRNLALFYRAVGRNEDAQVCFEESIDKRKRLHNYFQLSKLNKTITEQIKMEYYLSLKDNLKDVEPGIQRKRIRELRDYIEEVNEVAFNRKHLINDIERVLNEVSACTGYPK